MRRFREYYRQFEEMAPEEVSLELRARREEEKRRALSRIDPLDLSGTAWHEPPHPDAVNAATYALRRALNAYPDRSAAAVRDALAARHGVDAEHVALGHGAGELLRAACAALLGPASRASGGAARASGGAARASGGAAGANGGAGGAAGAGGGGEALVGWPGWQPLPALVEAAGGSAVPVPPAPAEILDRAGRDTRAVILCSPSDPTGELVSRRAVGDLCARLPEHVTVIVDEALGEFAPDGEDAAALVAELPNLLVIRSFSKAHAMAGLRAGAALGPPELVARLLPSGGMSAPAQAAAAWAASKRGAEIAARRRAAAALAHERLAAALAGSPVSAAPSGVPFAWLSSSEEDGPAIAARLAAQQVFVAPGRLWGDERHVRAALRGPAAVDRLAAALLSG